MTNKENKEKLIELLSEVAAKVVHIPTDRFIAYLADYLIANGVTFAKDTDVPSKWINVEDRLPEGTKAPPDVLVRHKLGSVMYVDRAWYDSDSKRWRSAMSMNMKVTHWMPMPEPPKQDKE